MCLDSGVSETTTPTGKEAAMTDTIRTYETFEILWSNEDGSHSTWTNYDQADADATVAFAAQRGGRHGEVVRRTFEVRIPAASRHLYTGTYIAERTAP